MNKLFFLACLLVALAYDTSESQPAGPFSSLQQREKTDDNNMAVDSSYPSSTNVEWTYVDDAFAVSFNQNGRQFKLAY